jgi:hypothetical protein
MQALPIVRDLEIFKDAGSRLLDRLEVVALDTFSFERRKKALHERVVVRFPTTTQLQSVLGLNPNDLAANVGKLGTLRR